jgi:hypothetical protein
MSIEVVLGPDIAVTLGVTQAGNNYVLQATVDYKGSERIAALIDLDLPRGLQGASVTGVHTEILLGPGSGPYVGHVISKSATELMGHAAHEAASEPMKGTISVGSYGPTSFETTWSDLSKP